MGKTFGIDVSKWQSDFDFELAANEGVKFAVIRGAYSAPDITTNAGKDTRFERHYNAAKAAGLPVGCYQYSMARTVEQAKEEAKFFYDNVLKGKQFELPVYIDIEDDVQRRLGARLLTDIVKTWCNYLESKGYWVGIYSTTFFFKTYLYDNELLRYTHWIAEWSQACSYKHTNVLGMWQFGGEVNKIRSNKIAGVTCDQNYMYVDFPTIIKNGGFNGYAKATEKPAKPAPVKKSAAEIAKEVIAGKWGSGADRKNKLTAAGYDYAEVQGIVNDIMAGDKPATKALAIGDKVKLTADATVYGSATRFQSWVYNATLYVRDINGDRVVISTQPTGDITGATHIKNVKRG